MQISPEWLHKQAAEIEALRKLLVLARAERDDLAAGHYASVTAERERCAAVCEGLEIGTWLEHKKNPGQHLEGRSDGAAECAALIRGA